MQALRIMFLWQGQLCFSTEIAMSHHFSFSLIFCFPSSVKENSNLGWKIYALLFVDGKSSKVLFPGLATLWVCEQDTSAHCISAHPAQNVSELVMADWYPVKHLVMYKTTGCWDDVAPPPYFQITKAAKIYLKSSKMTFFYLDCCFSDH